MIYDSLQARREMLSRLRRALSGQSRIFRDTTDRSDPPDPPTPVTQLAGDDPRTLAARFGANLEAVAGGYEILEDANDVCRRAIELLREWSADDAPEVLSWAPRALPIENFGARLEEAGVTLVVPENLHDEHTRARAARPTIGITSAEAAFASTGSLLLGCGRGKSRAASLLPLRHLVILPMSRIYPNFELWLHTRRQEQQLHSLLRVNGQIVFITGPSKSADIELNLTLGVHGPKTVHALIFDDRW